MISIAQLNQFYGGSHILRDIDLQIEAGKISALMGRNGVGKTTLLKCIMGLLEPRSGDIRFMDNQVTELPTEQRARLGIAYVPQGRMIFPSLTVEENLRVALAARTDSCQSVPDLVYELFPVLRDMHRRRGGDLSGGQQQQLAIGRALAQNPKMLVLDEPCEGIQPSIVQEIAESLVHLNAHLGLTVLVVEQRLKFVRSVASHFHIMERGQIRKEGVIGELSESMVSQYLTV